MWRSREQPHITHKMMVWLRDSTVPFSSSFDPMLSHRTTGNATCPWFCTCTAQQLIILWETHYSMGDPSFMLMFGRFQVLPQLTQTNAIDATSYLAHLTTKIVELQDLVESNLAAAAKNQKTAYDKYVLHQSFAARDAVWLSIPAVWLSIPMVGKLDPRWKGGWEIKSSKSAKMWKSRTAKYLNLSM